MAGAYSGSLIIVSISAPIHKRPLFTSFMGAVYGVGGQFDARDEKIVLTSSLQPFVE
jgi:hypothetical protein